MIINGCWASASAWAAPCKAWGSAWGVVGAPCRLGGNGRHSVHALHQHLSGQHHVNSSRGLGAGHLKRPLHYVLYVLRAAQFVVPFSEVSQSAGLVKLLLNPVDIHALAAGHFAVERHGRPSCAQHYARTASLRVVHASAKLHGARIHMDQHNLRLPGHVEVSVRRGDGRSFVRAQNYLRRWPALVA